MRGKSGNFTFWKISRKKIKDLSQGGSASSLKPKLLEYSRKK